MGEASGPVHPDPWLSVLTWHNNQPFWCGQKRLRNLLSSSNIDRPGYLLMDTPEDWALWGYITAVFRALGSTVQNQPMEDSRVKLLEDVLSILHPMLPSHKVGVFYTWKIRKGAVPQKVKTKTNPQPAFQQFVFLTRLDRDPLCEMKQGKLGQLPRLPRSR